MAERRAAGNPPAWEDLRALGRRGRVAALVALAAALQSVLALPVLVRGPNTHVHYQRLVAFADPDVVPESGLGRQVVRIAVFAAVLGWLTHRSADRPWSGSRILFVATASMWGCVAGVVSAIVWSLGEWFGDVSRTLAVIEVGEALRACDAAAFQGLVVGLVAATLTAVVTAPRPGAAAIPSVSLAASPGPRWWVTPAVGAMWAFVFGTAKYTAWVDLFTWHSPTSAQFEDAGSPTPSSVLLGLLAWPPEGRHESKYMAMSAIFLVACLATEWRLLSKAGTDTMLVFFSRCCALGLYTALSLFPAAAEGAVLRHGVAPNMTVVQAANLAAHLMPEALRDSVDQILLRGPILLAVPVLGMALIASAVDRLHAYPAVRGEAVTVGCSLAVAVCFVAMRLLPAPGPWQPPWYRAACPPKSGACEGVRDGDLDGDGVIDHVGLTAARPAPGAPERREAALHVVTADGSTYDQVLAVPRTGLTVRWLGLADVNADSRNEAFVALFAGTRPFEAIALEAREGRLAPLRGIKDGRIAFHDAGDSLAGFTCSDGPRMTIWKVRRTTGKSPVYKGSEEIWEASPGGPFRLARSRRVHFPADEGAPNSRAAREIEKNFGAHCQGLGGP